MLGHLCVRWYVTPSLRKANDVIENFFLSFRTRKHKTQAIRKDEQLMKSKAALSSRRILWRANKSVKPLLRARGIAEQEDYFERGE
jgi:hypothetical protein